LKFWYSLATGIAGRRHGKTIRSYQKKNEAIPTNAIT